MKTRWLLLCAGLLGCGQPNHPKEKPNTPTPNPGPQTIQEAPQDKERFREDPNELVSLPWFGPDGRELSNPRCNHITNLTSLRQGDILWSACREDPTYPGGALLRIDPGAKRIDSSWQFPKELPPSELLGVAELPNQRLGLVYQTKTPSGASFVAAITGANGWELTPTALNINGRLLGVRWVKGALELVYRPSEGSCEIKIARIDAAGQRGERSLDLTNPKPSDEEKTSADVKKAVIEANDPTTKHTPLFCYEPAFAYQRPKEESWRFIINSANPQDLPEGGAPAPLKGSAAANTLPLPLPSGVLFHEASPAPSGPLLSPTGEVFDHLTKPEGAYEFAAQHMRHYEFVDGYLSSACQFDRESPAANFSPIDGRLVELSRGADGKLLLREVSPRDADPITIGWIPEDAVLDNPLLQKARQEAIEANPALAKDAAPKPDPYRCIGMMTPTFIPRQGGYWLVNPNGCVLSIAHR